MRINSWPSILRPQQLIEVSERSGDYVYYVTSVYYNYVRPYDLWCNLVARIKCPHTTVEERIADIAICAYILDVYPKSISSFPGLPNV